MTDSILLTGVDLTSAGVAAVAGGAGIRLAAEGLKRMRRCRLLLDAALAEDRPILGVATGPVEPVDQPLGPGPRQRISANTVRGPARATGAPMDPALVRAAMCVRANTLLIGAAAARPEMAELIAGCLAAGLTPVVPRTGSNAGDAMWGGALGLGLVGEGEMTTPGGVRPAAEALAEAGLAPYAPAAREGLALGCHSSFVAGIAAVGVERAWRAFHTAQTAAALSLEGFRANLGPLDPRALMLRPQAGQIEAAAGLMLRLEGSALTGPGAARRMRDPLSLRCVAQIHGAATAALASATAAVTAEINGASDSPAVLEATGEITSHGGVLTPHLTVTLGALAQALVQLATAQVARMAKLQMPGLSDLPDGFGAEGPESVGMAPVTRSAEALLAEIVQLAQPMPAFAGVSDGGLDDVASHSAIPANALLAIVERLHRLSAIELMVAAQAIDLRGLGTEAPRLAAAIARIRGAAAAWTQDRPLSGDIERLAAGISAGDFELPEPE